jgi:hypothetical protein
VQQAGDCRISKLFCLKSIPFWMPYSSWEYLSGEGWNITLANKSGKKLMERETRDQRRYLHREIRYCIDVSNCENHSALQVAQLCFWSWKITTTTINTYLAWRDRWILGGNCPPHWALWPSKERVFNLCNNAHECMWRQVAGHTNQSLSKVLGFSMPRIHTEFHPVFLFSWAPPLVLHIFSLSYLYNYYN